MKKIYILSYFVLYAPSDIFQPINVEYAQAF